MGGIAGRLDYDINNIEIENCTNYGAVRGYSWVGGIIGGISSQSQEGKLDIKNCENIGVVSNSNTDIGGILGFIQSANECNIENCVNIGDINGASVRNAGILGGLQGKASINKSANLGSVSCSYSHAGGIIGELTGRTGESIIKIYNSYNAGNIKGGSSGGTGGISGTSSGNQEIYNCYNTGEVTSEGSSAGLGGFIALLKNGDKIENCYSTTVITEDSYTAAGFVGYGGGTNLSNCYANSASTNLVPKGSTITGVTGISEADMKSSTFATTLNNGRGSYSEWVYDANKNGGYPYLKDNYHE